MLNNIKGNRTFKGDNVEVVMPRIKGDMQYKNLRKGLDITIMAW